MYLDYFKMSRMPFNISPDPAFLWKAPRQAKTYDALGRAILEKDGVVVITGEPGTGKSTLLNAAIAKAAGNIRIAKITDPALNELDLVNVLASTLEMSRTFKNQAEFLIELERISHRFISQRLILVIDEAQRLTPEMLTKIGELAALAAPGGKGLTCVFAGYPDFWDTLNKCRVLSRRVVFRHETRPLTRSETKDYIAHRLSVAGCQRQIFTSSALQKIYILSKGIPRLINIICDNTLINGFAMNATKLGPDVVVDSSSNTLVSQGYELSHSSVGDRERSRGQAEKIEPATPVNKRWVWRSRQMATTVSAIAIILIAALTILFYLSGGLSPPGSDSRDDVAAKDKSGQAVLPLSSNFEDRLLQVQIDELRLEKDAALKSLQALQAKFEALEGRLKELQAAGERAASLEIAVSWKDAAIAELERRLERSSSSRVEALERELDIVKKENSRLRERLTEIQEQKNGPKSVLHDTQPINANMSTGL